MATRRTVTLVLAGILLALGLPVLVCKEADLDPTGIFDAKVGDRYVVILEADAESHRNSAAAKGHYRSFYTAVAERFSRGGPAL